VDAVDVALVLAREEALEVLERLVARAPRLVSGDLRDRGLVDGVDPQDADARGQRAAGLDGRAGPTPELQVDLAGLDAAQNGDRYEHRRCGA
jgi:hypothetical protein